MEAGVTIEFSEIKDIGIELAEQFISSAEPLVVIKQDTSVELISNSFERLTGFSGKELLGRKAPYPWWTEETLIKNSNTLTKIIDGDSGSFIELYRKKDGEQFCAEVDSQIIAIAGNEKHYSIRLVDIVKFENIDKIQLGLELYTHKLIQNASYPILVVNPDSTIKCVNHALEEMTGYRAHELVGTGTPYPWATHEEKSINYDILKVNEQTRRIGVWRVEKLLHNRSGKLYWIEVSGIPVLRAGKLQYYVCNWRDITEQKLLEQKIIRTSSKLDNIATYMNCTLNEERKKISRELHDEIGQSLTFLKMKLASFEVSLRPGQDSLQKRTESMYKLIDNTLAKVQKLCAELGPQVLEDSELTSAMESLDSQVEESSGKECENMAVTVGMIPDHEKPTHTNLSPREFQIMCMIARGMRLTDIARELYLSVKTVSTYRANILTKMNCTTNAELTHYTIANKLIEW